MLTIRMSSVSLHQLCSCAWVLRCKTYWKGCGIQYLFGAAWELAVGVPVGMAQVADQWLYGYLKFARAKTADIPDSKHAQTSFTHPHGNAAKTHVGE